MSYEKRDRYRRSRSRSRSPHNRHSRSYRRNSRSRSPRRGDYRYNNSSNNSRNNYRRHESSSSSRHDHHRQRSWRRRDGHSRQDAKKQQPLDRKTFALFAKSAFNFSYFRDWFTSHGFTERSMDDVASLKNVGFVFNDNQIPSVRKMMYGVRTVLKNEMITDVVSNKAQLHTLASSKCPEAIPETHTVSDVTRIKDGDLWIWRPAAGWKGMNIHVIKSQDRLTELWNQHKRAPKSGLEKKWPEIIITRYIEQPLLYQGRKTTFRIFAMACVVNKQRSAYMFERGFLRIGELPYALEDFDNVKIHDCHKSNTATDNKELFYPDSISDLVDTKDTSAQMRTILTNVFTPALADFSFYPESEHAYRIFGVDFMIDSTGRVFLIEMNGRPGFNLMEAEDTGRIYEMLSRGVFVHVAAPAFGITTELTADMCTQVATDASAL